MKEKLRKDPLWGGSQIWMAILVVILLFSFVEAQVRPKYLDENLVNIFVFRNHFPKIQISIQS